MHKKHFIIKKIHMDLVYNSQTKKLYYNSQTLLTISFIVDNIYTK
jgi:hypothetical protein